METGYILEINKDNEISFINEDSSKECYESYENHVNNKEEY